MVMLARKVTTKVTALDVYVDGVRIGWITDCGDCWRGSLFGRLRRRVLPDYDSRNAARRGVVDAWRLT
jgi:hypothetical protein